MQPPWKKMLAFEKEPVVLISLNKYMPLRIEKEKKYVRFGNLWPNFEQVYTSWEQNREK